MEARMGDADSAQSLAAPDLMPGWWGQGHEGVAPPGSASLQGTDLGHALVLTQKTGCKPKMVSTISPCATRTQTRKKQ